MDASAFYGGRGVPPERETKSAKLTRFVLIMSGAAEAANALAVELGPESPAAVVASAIRGVGPEVNELLDMARQARNLEALEAAQAEIPQ